MTSSPDASCLWTPLDLATGGRAVPGGPPGASPAPCDYAFPELHGVAATAERAVNAEQAGLQDSYARGFADGVREGEARSEQRLRPAREALTRVVEALEAAREEFARERERNLAGLALAVARKLVQRELSADPGLVKDLVTRALDLLPLDTSLEVRLNPVDLAALGDRLETFVPAGRTLTIHWVADPALEQGGFMMESAQRIVDGRSDTALRMLYERLAYE